MYEDWRVLHVDERISVYLTVDTGVSSVPPTDSIFISKSLPISKDLSWHFFVNGKSANHIPLLDQINEKLTIESLKLPLDIVKNPNQEIK